ncbi:MAG: hypothetical protein FJW40_06560 [Acidobacteria bacterium]|nr:hypothetical protein [Acidobacteriota bacterium]
MTARWLRGGRASWYVDGFLLALAVFVLIRPWFRARFVDNWGSIESTFIADARFLKDHWPRPGWQPLWYCGTRFDYVYPPALRYGTAALARYYPRMTPAKAYRIYTGAFYIVGIVGVYLFIRGVYGNRAVALGGAVAAALISPSFLLLPEIRHDAAHYTPMRLGVLVRYGEGPHMTALALIPLALLAAWRAMLHGRPWAIIGASVACALVVSNNFYGATALALFYLLVLWAVWLTHQDRRAFLRAAVVPVLAYGLTAWWLVPSYFSVTLRNMVLVSNPGTPWSLWLMTAVVVAFLLASERWARGRRERAWPVFVAGCVTIFTLNVLGNALFNFRVIGEPGRLVPEWDLVLILALLLAAERLWRWRRWTAVAFAVVCLAPAPVYLRHSRQIFPRAVEPFDRMEYQVQDWLHRNMPGARVFAAGSLRFWFNAWNDIAQVGGGSEQGLSNMTVMPAQWEINLGDSPKLAALWLQAVGADAVVVSGPKSRDAYRDILFPARFKGQMETVYDNGSDDVIYRVPRVAPGLARVVDRAAMTGLKPVTQAQDQAGLEAYVRVIEAKGADAKWVSPDELRIEGDVAAGQALLVQESFDPAWRAETGGTAAEVRRDPLGFMVVDVPPGRAAVTLRFETPLENRVGQGACAAAVAAMAALAVLGRRRAA